jgi:mono/diheme cytochrome c family protein
VRLIRGMPLLGALALVMILQSRTLAQDDVALRRQSAVEDAASLGIGRVVPDLRIEPLKGDATTLSKQLSGRSGLVICMTSTDCPLAVRYSPRLAGIEDEYAKRGISFVYVNCVDAESAKGMVDAIRQQGFDGPYVADRRHDIQHALKARTTTEVFVLDASRVLVYRGAIDDQFGVGRALDRVRHAYLRDALDAVLEKQRPDVSASWPPGCVLDPAPTTTRPASDLTYYGDIAHNLARNCVGCHRRGGVAPFSLESLQSVKGRFSMIEAVVRDRLMPPGHVLSRDRSGENPWVNDPMLDDSDRDALLAWLGSDRPAGSRSDAPKIPALSQTWAIGEPDVLLTTPPLELPEYGPLQGGRFVIPTDIEKDEWISAIEFRPIERDSVHHALVWIMSPGDRLPGKSELPVHLELLGSFSPADGMIQYPSDVGRRLPGGSLLVVDIYASPMGRTKGSRLRVAMRFASGDPRREVRSLIVSDASPRIAPGASIDHRVEHLLASAVSIRAVMPYMRARGRSMEIGAAMPKGEVSPILGIERYDFRWPIRYERGSPLTLTKGTRIVVSGHFDNSHSHLSNPDPSGAVQIGPGAGDEALIVAFEIETDIAGRK